MDSSNEAGSRLVGMLLQRCPRCLGGPVFRSVLQMNDVCPQCGFRFGREEGYFTGAMYFSFMIALLFMFGLYGILWLFSSKTLTAGMILLAVVSGLYVAMVPLVFRYSRVIWMYFDWRFGPDRRQSRNP